MGFYTSKYYNFLLYIGTIVILFKRGHRKLIFLLYAAATDKVALRSAGNVRKSRGRRIGTIQKIKKNDINIIRFDVESSVSVCGLLL
jgi:hypothetical protein